MEKNKSGRLAYQSAFFALVHYKLLEIDQVYKAVVASPIKKGGLPVFEVQLPLLKFNFLVNKENFPIEGVEYKVSFNQEGGLILNAKQLLKPNTQVYDDNNHRSLYLAAAYSPTIIPRVSIVKRTLLNGNITVYSDEASPDELFDYLDWLTQKMVMHFGDLLIYLGAGVRWELPPVFLTTGYYEVTEKGMVSCR